MPSKITLEPLQPGSDPNVVGKLNDFWQASWDDSELANIALITFQTNVTWQDSSHQYVNVDIQPSPAWKSRSTGSSPPLTNGQNSYTLYSKDGLTNAQGFSSYMGFVNFPAALPNINPLSQVGVIVLVNKAIDDKKATPTAFGKSIIKYLLGFPSAPVEAEDIHEPDYDDVMN
ncbi:MAG TPA: hypothetical protein VGZ22_15440 [Isosphaeraceae bacterium]|nr:hypothetical protein [Isosphaeraceae bacterium]